jgi:hypothetical protein
MLVQFFRTIPFEYDEAALSTAPPNPDHPERHPAHVPLGGRGVGCLHLPQYLERLHRSAALPERQQAVHLGSGPEIPAFGYNSYWHILMAAATMVAAPLIVVFFFAQKSFIEGLTMGGIKG